MARVERSYSQQFIPPNAAINNSSDGASSFPVDGPVIRESAAGMPSAALGKTTSSASDVAALLSAVGGEQMQYIEFNSVRRELEIRQQWPLLHFVSELLDKPKKPADVAKPVVLPREGVAI